MKENEEVFEEYEEINQDIIEEPDLADDIVDLSDEDEEETVGGASNINKYTYSYSVKSNAILITNVRGTALYSATVSPSGRVGVELLGGNCMRIRKYKTNWRGQVKVVVVKRNAANRNKKDQSTYYITFK